MRNILFIILSGICVFFGIATLAPESSFVGSIGTFVGRWNYHLFGFLSFVYPFMLIYPIYFLCKKKLKFDIKFLSYLLGVILLFVAILMSIALVSLKSSGIVGSWLIGSLGFVIGTLGVVVLIFVLFAISFGLLFEQGFIEFLNKCFAVPVQFERKKPNFKKTIDVEVSEIPQKEQIPSPKISKITESEITEIETKELETQISDKADKKIKLKSRVELLSEVAENKAILSQIEKGNLQRPKDFTLPPLKFLSDAPKKTSLISEDEIDKKVFDLLDKLRKFKIDGDVVRTYTGPIVTTFEFRPAPHIKVSKISTLQDDLAMALKAQTIRIQAPIPGKDVVGIEVPNENLQTIYLKEILESEIFKTAASPLTMALGKDIVGAPFVTDLKKLPHLLVAGTTGSGKSVGINAMVLSLLYRNSPKTLRLMMIDPKMLEFSIYNDIPHLLTPVITQSKQAITALSNMVAEMERRYTVMSQTRTKNIESYNEKMRAEGGEELPYIVVIIDELADLMMTSGKDVEFYIGRLAQMARASGIHLIVATQRPSVDVVTGLIKANLPSRISYRVGQKIDSKVILDQMGAESLLGRGDMLFTPPGSPGVIRLHAPFTSEKEIENIVEFLKSQQEVVYDDRFLSENGDKSGVSSEVKAEDLDELFEDAKSIILSERKTSISYLQRRLGVGYNRAANIIEQLEQMGILSEVNAKGQREIL